MARFSSQLEDFLFAVIGEAEGGTPLTVISAFARCGKDPWIEAAQLAELPKSHASENLNAFLANIPPLWCSIPDRRTTAARLINLLPHQATVLAAKSRFVDFRARHETRFLAITCLLLFVTVICAYAFS